MISSLRRYTSLPFLIDILKEKRLTFVYPKYWDDKNDFNFVNKYKKDSDLTAVLALCFTEFRETYFHWKIYSDGVSGVCIEFDKDLLLTQFQKFKGIKSGYVDYKTLRQLDNNEIDFTKRFGFKEENEFRIIYEVPRGSPVKKFKPIELNCIKRIIFSPWIPTPVYNANKAVLEEITKSNFIEIDRSTLTNNKTWKQLGIRIQKPHDLQAKNI